MTDIAKTVADICINCLNGGGKILFCGNGGSAADSQHLAAELIGKLNKKRAPLAAIALTTDTSIITAIGNDYGFEFIFSRQIEGLGHAGDVLIAISTSGNSPNILEAIKAAKKKNMWVIGMTGASGGAMAKKCDAIYHAPYASTQTIQECHITFGHVFCGLIEKGMFA